MPTGKRQRTTPPVDPEVDLVPPLQAVLKHAHGQQPAQRQHKAQPLRPGRQPRVQLGPQRVRRGGRGVGDAAQHARLAGRPRTRKGWEGHVCVCVGVGVCVGGGAQQSGGLVGQ
jgi:hypothetical protein